MPFVVLVPARLASTRLPRKALADIGGVPMIVRVARRAAASKASRVVVAADDAEIVAACAAHGVTALLTSPRHATGSDRIAEASAALGLGNDGIAVRAGFWSIGEAVVDAVVSRYPMAFDCAKMGQEGRRTA